TQICRSPQWPQNESATRSLLDEPLSLRARGSGDGSVSLRVRNYSEPSPALRAPSPKRRWDQHWVPRSSSCSSLAQFGVMPPAAAERLVQRGGVGETIGLG